MMLQFDLYTGGELKHLEVLDYLTDEFSIQSMDWQFIDRENGFELVDSNVNQKRR
jgi:hypothetical protein